jgi:hypothetical protein
MVVVFLSAAASIALLTPYVYLRTKIDASSIANFSANR